MFTANQVAIAFGEDSEDEIDAAQRKQAAGGKLDDRELSLIIDSAMRRCADRARIGAGKPSKFDAWPLRMLYRKKLLQVRNDRGQGMPSKFDIEVANEIFNGMAHTLGDRVQANALLNIIGADVGSGKTTCAFAFIAALTEHAETRKDWPAGVIYSCEQIVQCDAAYRELSKLLPDQVAVWSKEHDPDCKVRERLQEPAAEFTQDELIDYPVIVVTHEFLRVGGDKVRLWNHGDQKRYRALTIIDERPEWIDVFDLTIRQAHEIKEELVRHGAGETVNRNVAKLCDLMADYELNDGNRIKIIENSDSVRWFTGFEAQNTASKYSSKIVGLRHLFSFTKALTQGCAFSAPSGNLTHLWAGLRNARFAPAAFCSTQPPTLTLRII